MSRGPRAGFSALEALIAAAILGLVMIPLLDLQRQADRDARRFETMRTALLAQRSAMDLLTSVNPMLEPVGRRDLSTGVAMQWRAAPISRRVRSIGYLNAEGDFDVALYRLEVEILQSNRPIATFSFEQEGWRPLQAAESPDRRPRTP